MHCLQEFAQTKAAMKLEQRVSSLRRQRDARKRKRVDDIAQAETSAVDYLTPWKQQQSTTKDTKKFKSDLTATAAATAAITPSCGSGSNSSNAASNTSSSVHGSSVIQAKGNSVLSSTMWSLVFQYVGAWDPYSDTIEGITTAVHDVANLAIVCSDTYTAAI
jgi:hypothetical protein